MSQTTTGPTPATEPRVILVVVVALFAIVVLGFVGTFWLILQKCEGSLIAVFSGLTGTALGMLGSLLNNTRTTPPVPDTADIPALPVPPAAQPTKP